MISVEVKEYLSKVCTILYDQNVEYLVVGGVAVAHYGFNRPSGVGQQNLNIKIDLDFWYNPTIENFKNIIRSLDLLEIETSDLKSLVFDRNHTFLKIPYKDFHMDFLPRMEGLGSFRESQQNSESINIANITVNMMSLDDLILNKKVVNRPIDHTDIDALTKVKNQKSPRRKP